MQKHNFPATTQPIRQCVTGPGEGMQDPIPPVRSFYHEDFPDFYPRMCSGIGKRVNEG
jgi:hypothetical protein